PLALYDAARGFDRESPSPLLGRAMLFMVAVAAHLCSGNLSAETIALSTVFAFAATLLSVRTTQVEREYARNATVRDDLQERTLLLEAKNRDLLERQDYEVQVATLAERARIAREIHDNVGHQLTRAKLQTDALAIVHEADPAAAADFQSVGRAVDEALSLVRASVHDLHDDSFDLGLQAHKAADAIMRGSSVRVAVEVSCEHVPANVGACLLAVMREAMSNALRHGHAGRIEVRCLEHPALWQLSVLDDGGTMDGMAAGAMTAGATVTGAPADHGRRTSADHGRRTSADQTTVSGQFHTSGGMGLASMRERVEALSGSFSAGPRRDSAGWRVFASIPKERAGAA
ncbi:MAG: histidine kinase, partial [Parolsenella sp.]|uniref:sensor histidine kinase n=1 Tax=Parolsenella sp. TaxID=2083006 RepID=UPI002E76744C